MLDAYNAVLDAIKEGRGCGVGFEAPQEDNVGMRKDKPEKDVALLEMRTHAVVWRPRLSGPAVRISRRKPLIVNEDWGLKRSTMVGNFKSHYILYVLDSSFRG